jgi:hypothetical protein
MTNERIQTLINLGFDETWLQDIKDNFKPNAHGKYLIRIYDCEDLDQEIETGIFIGNYYFSNERDLSVIHHFFEGMFYIINTVKDNEELGRGIVDGAPFDEMEEYEGNPWRWLHCEELSDEFKKREEERNQKILELNKKLMERENEYA